MQINKRVFFLLLSMMVFTIGVLTKQPYRAFNQINSLRLDDERFVKYYKECESEPYDEISFDSSPRSNCYQSKVRFLIKNYSLKTAINGLKGYMQTEEGKLLDGRRCHDLGHGIGIEAVKSGVPSREILTECADWCVGGCLNGASHLYVLTDHTPEQLVQFCDVDGIEEKSKRMCYHGLGHGYMENFNADITKAMDFCEKIPQEVGQYECGHAAVMDYALLYSAPVRSIPEDIVGFCDARQKVFRPSCYEFVGFLAYSRTVNTKDSFEACRKIPSEFRRNCTQRIGEAYFSILERDPDKIVAGCEVGTGEEIDDCMEGSVRSSIYGADSSFGQLGAIFCGKLLSINSRAYCYKFLGGEIEAVHGQERRLEACNRLDGIDKTNCESVRMEKDKKINE